MSMDRSNLPVYDYSCSHMKNFVAYMEEVSVKFSLDISNIKRLYGSRVCRQINVYVFEDLVKMVKELCPELKKAEDENGLSSPIKVYIASLKHRPHFEVLLQSRSADKENILLVVIQNGLNLESTQSFLKDIRLAHTTMKMFEDDLNDVLERWVCDVSKSIVETLRKLREQIRTSEKGISSHLTGMLKIG